jgi:VWFA-related protein
VRYDSAVIHHAEDGARPRRQPLVLVAALVSLLLAHGAAREVDRTDQPFRVRTDLVVVDAQVVDRDGAVVPRLDAADFEIDEDGVRQRITHFSQDGLPLSLVLLLDASGSVLPSLGEIHEGARRALRGLKAEDAVAVMAFGTASTILRELTRDRALAAAAIAGLDADAAARLGEATYLDDALLASATYLRGAAPPGSRRLVVLVTDNWSNQPPEAGHAARTTAALLESGVVVSGVVVGDFPVIQRALTRKAPAARRRVQRDPLLRTLLAHFRRDPSRLRDPVGGYAAATGGLALDAAAGDGAERLVELIERLRRMYSFGYVSSNAARDGAFRRVAVTLSARGRSRAPEARILARRGYYAPGVEPPPPR